MIATLAVIPLLVIFKKPPPSAADDETMHVME
jgi:hypothetical protein